MAYKPRNLSVLAYANGFTLWHYVTDDDGRTLTGPGYFDDAADMLRTGDMILGNCQDGQGGVTALFLHVTGGEAVRNRAVNDNGPKTAEVSVETMSALAVRAA